MQFTCGVFAYDVNLGFSFAGGWYLTQAQLQAQYKAVLTAIVVQNGYTYTRSGVVNSSQTTSTPTVTLDVFRYYTDVYGNSWGAVTIDSQYWNGLNYYMM